MIVLMPQPSKSPEPRKETETWDHPTNYLTPIKTLKAARA